MANTSSIIKMLQGNYQLVGLNVEDTFKKTDIDVQKDEKGKLKITVDDTEQGKSLKMNFCTKAKLERVLQERMGSSTRLRSRRLRTIC
jgi:hypothetical protein